MAVAIFSLHWSPLEDLYKNIGILGKYPILKYRNYEFFLYKIIGL